MKTLTPSEQQRLKTFFARTSVAARLLNYRLSLPLTYPLNAASTEHLSEDLKQGPLAFKKQEQATCLAHIKPIIVGISHLSSTLKALHGVGKYGGSSEERLLHHEKDREVRMDYIRPENLRRAVRQSKVGLGVGWEEWGSGRPADDVRRRFNTELPLKKSPA